MQAERLVEEAKEKELADMKATNLAAQNGCAEWLHRIWWQRNRALRQLRQLRQRQRQLRQT